MIIERIYDEKLAQASYLIGCAATGEALVVDPNRDVQQYIDLADHHGVRITHITETHIHADFVSGARELAERTAGRLYLSDEGDENWKYLYAAQYDAVLLKDGHRFKVGNVQVDVRHTPGHTPEHLTFVITDTAAADEPIGALTGDFIFVGDVGRPDLLERAAGVAGTMEVGARTLFRSLQRFLGEYPDWLQIWPGHGAGSACGKGLSAVPHSTLGYERRFNWAFDYTDEGAFVEAVLAGQPEPPKYFAQMKRINKEGPRVLREFSKPRHLPAVQLPGLLQKDAIVIDTRPAGVHAVGHVPGTINIPLNRSFNTWAGWLVPYDRDFYLIVDDASGHGLSEAVRDLAMIGLDRVGGYFSTEVFDAWTAAGHELGIVPQITSHELRRQLQANEAWVVDVRGRAEWEAGRIPGVPSLPLGYLADRLAELPRDRTIVVSCQGGARSAIGASLLYAHGFQNVVNFAGGFAEWQASGAPVARGAETEALLPEPALR
ncbi:MAG TPA: rhodanese-like domain-containing protein [Longimicrobiales bacterium]|nr:rhodanese-like domain-containing protein [Longimicrobiales bacterium]